MEFFDLLDKLIRRNPLVPHAPWLRRALRGPYHKLMGLNSKGLPLAIGGSLKVRLPAEFCAKELERYEMVTAAAVREWISHNKGGLFVDIGCSYGYFSCGLLFHDPSATVMAIDSDLPSLTITRYVCSLAPAVDQRLELYRALIGTDSQTTDVSASMIREKTVNALKKKELKARPDLTNYVNFDTKIDERELPRISLDTFLLERLDKTRTKCCIKCDVEGAEQIVLEGSSTLLRKHDPTLLISVHPQYLPKFGGSTNSIRRLLESNGYEIEVIGIDHEEHWLCGKTSAAYD